MAFFFFAIYFFNRDFRYLDYLKRFLDIVIVLSPKRIMNLIICCSYYQYCSFLIRFDIHLSKRYIFIETFKFKHFLFQNVHLKPPKLNLKSLTVLLTIITHHSHCRLPRSAHTSTHSVNKTLPATSHLARARSVRNSSGSYNCSSAYDSEHGLGTTITTQADQQGKHYTTSDDTQYILAADHNTSNHRQ